MNISIRASGIELTDMIRDYAEQKMQSLEKYFDRIISIAIDIGLTSTHHHKGKIFYAEVNVRIPHGELVRVRKETEDLYKSIDKVRDHLKVELDASKEKKRAKDRKVLREIKGYQG